jgi:hypothetical protein
MDDNVLALVMATKTQLRTVGLIATGGAVGVWITTGSPCEIGIVRMNRQ